MCSTGFSSFEFLSCRAKRSVWTIAAAVQITSGNRPARGEGRPTNRNSTPDAIITIDQRMRAFAPYLLIAYQFALDVNAFEMRNP